MKEFIKRQLEKLPHNTLHGSRGPYLTRYTLLNLGKSLVRVRLHHFHRGDEDLELHSHPWSWAFALILKGGYWEERLIGNKLQISRLGAGDFNLLLSDTFHRVLKADGTWTLFIAGPEVDTWYFMDHVTRRVWPWKEYVRMMHPEVAEA